MKLHFPRSVRTALALGLGIACTSLAMQARAADAAPIEITVSAAASLTDAFTEVARAFEAQYPGIRVTPNFAASGVLLGQLKQGAPVDVLATADETTMNAAASAGLVDRSTRVDFAANALVVVVPSGSPSPASLKALTGPQYKRIAIGTVASVPAGAYAAQAIDTAGLDAALAPRLIYGANVRQVLAYVARGEVDAGFVYRTDAKAQAGKVEIAFDVPTATPVLYPVAVVRASGQAAAARSFVDFVRGDASQKILARFGFARP